MNNELLLEWCILNNPGVKQDIFPYDKREGNYTSKKEDNRYLMKSIGRRSEDNAGDFDTKFSANTKAGITAQFKDTSGMKANDLADGSDWINPRLAKKFFNLDEKHAKKLLRFAWLQGKLDSSKLSTNYDKSKKVINTKEAKKNNIPIPKDANYNITKYIQQVTLNDLQFNLIGIIDDSKFNNVNFERELAEKLESIRKEYIKSDRQQFSNNGKQVDQYGYAISNKVLLDVFTLNILASFPLWNKEFEIAYDRIMSILKKFQQVNSSIKLYRGIYLKNNTNTLNNYKFFKENPDELYKNLQNEYNSTTTELARAIYFAANPETEQLDHNSVIFEFDAKKDIINIPFTMYLNGKNGKYYESEVNILKDDTYKNNFKNITNIQAYIGLSSINNAFANRIYNLRSNVERARSSRNAIDLFNINFAKNRIEFINKETSAQNIMFDIKKSVIRTNINNAEEIKYNCVFIIAQVDKSTLPPELQTEARGKKKTIDMGINGKYYFLYDKFAHELITCEIKEEISENIDLQDSLKLTYDYTKALYNISLNNNLIATAQLSYDYNYLQRGSVAETYKKELEKNIITILKPLTNNDELKSELDIIEEKIKTIFNYSQKDIDELVNKINDIKDLENKLNTKKIEKTNILKKFINDIKTYITKYDFLDIKSFNNQLDEIDFNTLNNLNTILNNIKKEIINKFNKEQKEIENKQAAIINTNKQINAKIETVKNTAETIIKKLINKSTPVSIYSTIYTSLVPKTCKLDVELRHILWSALSNTPIPGNTRNQDLMSRWFNERETNIKSEIAPKIIDGTLTLDQYKTDTKARIDSMLKPVNTDNTDNTNDEINKLEQVENDYKINVTDKKSSLDMSIKDLDKEINDINRKLHDNDILPKIDTENPESQAKSYKFNNANSKLCEAFRYFLSII